MIHIPEIKPGWWTGTEPATEAERDAATDLAGALPIDPGALLPAPRADDPVPTCCPRCIHYWTFNGRAPVHAGSAADRDAARTKLLAAALALRDHESPTVRADREASLFAAALLYAAAHRPGSAP